MKINIHINLTKWLILAQNTRYIIVSLRLPYPYHSYVFFMLCEAKAFIASKSLEKKEENRVYIYCHQLTMPLEFFQWINHKRLIILVTWGLKVHVYCLYSGQTATAYIRNRILTKRCLPEVSVLRYEDKIKFKSFFAFVVMDFTAWFNRLGL